ncbi:MAG TPA: DNA-3-methyladenine glycosylase [Candidatus Paceibacterota bacterium]|nr:DNA-3-methyladenine glycosylase [Candidatus Paceibacterota bacterium]
MYKKARLHFKKHDPRLHAASLEYEIEDLEQSDDLFRDIASTIIGQQLSGKAADTIFGRFEALFPGKLILPEEILKLRDEQLRACGLSGAKARSIKDLAAKVISGDVNIERLPLLPDEEVMQELTKVKGIGPWTAEMVLMFSLGRTDVFSMGDLVLKKGLMSLYGWKKLPSARTVSKVLNSWSPYRTYAARILWKIEDRKKPGALRKEYEGK